MRGAWCVVRGAWCVVRGAWCAMCASFIIYMHIYAYICIYKIETLHWKIVGCKLVTTKTDLHANAKTRRWRRR